MAQRRELDWSGLRLTSFEPVAAAAVAVEKKGHANALGDPATVLSLNVSCNFVRTFSALHLAPFTNVAELYLGANELAEVPDLSALTGLRRLHLNNNRLTAIPTTLLQLASLEILDLRSNSIRTCAGLPPLPNLKWLSLSSNWLTDDGMNATVLPGLPALAFLGLYGNRLTDANALLAVLQVRCPALAELVVADNRWTTRQRLGLDLAAWSTGLPALEWLDSEYVDRRILSDAVIATGHADKRVRSDPAAASVIV